MQFAQVRLVHYNKYCSAIYIIFVHLPHPPSPPQPQTGDQVYYLENSRSAAELMASIWHLCYTRFNRRKIPVTVSSNISYNRTGGRKMVLKCDPGLERGVEVR